MLSVCQSSPLRIRSSLIASGCSSSQTISLSSTLSTLFASLSPTTVTSHLWQSYLDVVECIRKTEDAKCIYAMRQQTIERVSADAKEKHAMRYTHHRGLTAVTRWVKLKFAAMNLKKLAVWSWKRSFLSLRSLFPLQVFHKIHRNPCLAAC